VIFVGTAVLAHLAAGRPQLAR